MSLISRKKWIALATYRPITDKDTISPSFPRVILNPAFLDQLLKDRIPIRLLNLPRSIFPPWAASKDRPRFGSPFCGKTRAFRVQVGDEFQLFFVQYFNCGLLWLWHFQTLVPKALYLKISYYLFRMEIAIPFILPLD